MKDKRLEIRIDEKTRRKLKELAKAKGTSEAEQIRRAIEQRFEYFRKKGDLQAGDLEDQKYTSEEKAFLQEQEEILRILNTPWLP